MQNLEFKLLQVQEKKMALQSASRIRELEMLRRNNDQSADHKLFDDKFYFYDDDPVRSRSMSPNRWKTYSPHSPQQKVNVPAVASKTTMSTWLRNSPPVTQPKPNTNSPVRAPSVASKTTQASRSKSNKKTERVRSPRSLEKGISTWSRSERSAPIVPTPVAASMRSSRRTATDGVEKRRQTKSVKPSSSNRSPPVSTSFSSLPTTASMLLELPEEELAFLDQIRLEIKEMLSQQAKAMKEWMVNLEKRQHQIIEAQHFRANLRMRKQQEWKTRGRSRFEEALQSLKEADDQLPRAQRLYQGVCMEAKDAQACLDQCRQTTPWAGHQTQTEYAIALVTVCLVLQKLVQLRLQKWSYLRSRSAVRIEWGKKLPLRLQMHSALEFAHQMVEEKDVALSVKLFAMTEVEGKKRELLKEFEYSELCLANWGMKEKEAREAVDALVKEDAREEDDVEGKEGKGGEPKKKERKKSTKAGDRMVKTCHSVLQQATKGYEMSVKHKEAILQKLQELSVVEATRDAELKKVREQLQVSQQQQLVAQQAVDTIVAEMEELQASMQAIDASIAFLPKLAAATETSAATTTTNEGATMTSGNGDDTTRATDGENDDDGLAFLYNNEHDLQFAQAEVALHEALRIAQAKYAAVHPIFANVLRKGVETCSQQQALMKVDVKRSNLVLEQSKHDLLMFVQSALDGKLEGHAEPHGVSGNSEMDKGLQEQTRMFFKHLVLLRENVSTCDKINAVSLSKKEILKSSLRQLTVELAKIDLDLAIEKKRQAIEASNNIYQQGQRFANVSALNREILANDLKECQEYIDRLNSTIQQYQREMREEVPTDEGDDETLPEAIYKAGQLQIDAERNKKQLIQRLQALEAEIASSTLQEKDQKSLQDLDHCIALYEADLSRRCAMNSNWTANGKSIIQAIEATSIMREALSNFCVQQKQAKLQNQEGGDSGSCEYTCPALSADSIPSLESERVFQVQLLSPAGLLEMKLTVEYSHEKQDVMLIWEVKQLSLQNGEKTSNAGNRKSSKGRKGSVGGTILVDQVTLSSCLVCVGVEVGGFLSISQTQSPDQPPPLPSATTAITTTTKPAEPAAVPVESCPEELTEDMSGRSAQSAAFATTTTTITKSTATTTAPRGGKASRFVCCGSKNIMKYVEGNHEQSPVEEPPQNRNSQIISKSSEKEEKKALKNELHKGKQHTVIPVHSLSELNAASCFSIFLVERNRSLDVVCSSPAQATQWMNTFGPLCSHVQVYSASTSTDDVVKSRN